MTALTVAFYVALVMAVIASAGAVAPPRRRQLLAVAAGAYAVAGVLGILSIGIVFLAAAVVCALLALRTPPVRRV